MVLRYLFYVTALVQLVFGLGFLVIPETVGSQYGGTMNATAVAIGRYFGAALLPLAYVSWMAAGATASALKLVIVRVWAVTPVFSLIATLLANATGVVNVAGAVVNVVLTGVFLIGFGYYGWVKTSEE